MAMEVRAGGAGVKCKWRRQLRAQAVQSGCAGGAASVRERRTVVAARAHGGGVEERRRREVKRGL